MLPSAPVRRPLSPAPIWTRPSMPLSTGSCWLNSPLQVYSPPPSRRWSRVIRLPVFPSTKAGSACGRKTHTRKCHCTRPAPGVSGQVGGEGLPPVQSLQRVDSSSVVTTIARRSYRFHLRRSFVLSPKARRTIVAVAILISATPPLTVIVQRFPGSPGLSHTRGGRSRFCTTYRD